MEVSEKRKVCLVVTIHLRLNGYAPKQTLEFLKNIRYTDEQKKTSKFQNETCLPNGGGEGPSCSFSEFFVYIDIKSDLFLMRGYTFDDLCVYNNLY